MTGLKPIDGNHKKNFLSVRAVQAWNSLPCLVSPFQAKFSSKGCIAACCCSCLNGEGGWTGSFQLLTFCYSSHTRTHRHSFNSPLVYIVLSGLYSWDSIFLKLPQYHLHCCQSTLFLKFLEMQNCV